jgi:dienelactone hydrolase
MTSALRIGLVALTTALALTAAPAHAAPARPNLAAPTGQYAVGNTDLHLMDKDRADPWKPSRRRELMVTVWYPATRPGKQAPYVGPKLADFLDQNATPGLGLKPGQVDWAHIGTHASSNAPAARIPGRAPVLLYSPGGFESRAYGSSEAADLASNGYIVVSVDHTYETPVEFPDGLRPQLVTQASTEAENIPILRKINQARVADNKFVLDELTAFAAGRDADVDRRPVPRGLGANIDLSRIGLVGHSAGGDAAVETMYEDQRVDAAANLDGFLAYDFSGAHPLPAARNGVRRPFLLMGSQSATAKPDDTALILRTHRSSPAWASLWRRSPGWKLDLGTPLGRHHVFTDHLALLPQLAPLGVPAAAVTSLIGTSPDPARVLRSEHTYVRAFFEQHLRHVPQPVLSGPTPQNPDIEFER